MRPRNAVGPTSVVADREPRDQRLCQQLHPVSDPRSRSQRIDPQRDLSHLWDEYTAARVLAPSHNIVDGIAAGRAFAAFLYNFVEPTLVPR